MNRLADETSPYLRQHADNPVHWYPWGPEALAEAVASDRPLLISVGYSACHWCHVMAHESFEDPATANLMNEWFVNVKVDREERPDVDAVYMEATVAMTGRGGWPMTVFATPDGRPFYCGTYFPRVRRGGMPGFSELLTAVHDAWTSRRDELLEHADTLTAHLQRTPVAGPEAGPPGAEVCAAAAATMIAAADRQWGGFGRAPKFPQAMSLDHLLRHHVATGDPEALAVVVRSLDAMAAGGICDHLDGGFARYSTDDRWLVPHFEKMLYDNALLTTVYLHAWQVTGESRFARVVGDIVRYVLTDLRLDVGAFASAEDADSADADGHHHEGEFAVWTPEEVRAALTEAGLAEVSEEALAFWDITDAGNFEGRSIPNRIAAADRWAEEPDWVPRARAALTAARSRRPRPGLDDKVLTEWNALMIGALAEAGFVLDEPEWITAAVTAARFLLDELRDEQGRWLRAWHSGRARHDAVAADHAALVCAFVMLAECTGDPTWIDEAVAVADALLDRFEDHGGGVLTNAHDGEKLVANPKDLTDTATPSANSLMAVGLLRLAAITDEERYRSAAERVLAVVGPSLTRGATGFGMMLWAAELAATETTAVVIPGPPGPLLEAVRVRFLPRAVRLWGSGWSGPLWHGREPGRAFVCTGVVCRHPVADPAELLSQLDGVALPPNLG